MSIKSKWIGLEEYSLRLFLIKDRFFVTGSGIEENTSKLLALGFREVPKNALKEGAKNYWVAPSESGFLRRVVAAFPNYTVQMLPPEGINPTILVNKNQQFKGGAKNDTRQPRQRASDTRQPVVEAASGDSHVSDDGNPTVLGGASAPDDSGNQPRADGVDGRSANVSGLAEQDAGQLRGSSTDAPRTVEAPQSISGDSEPAGSGELAQPSEDGEPRSVPVSAGAELGADNADGARGRLLLGQADANRIKNAMDRRVLLVERLSGDTVSLAQHVAQAIEENNYARHAELRAAYEALEKQEPTFALAQLFYVTDQKDGVIAVVDSLGDADVTVGRARGILDGAGYGWVAEHIKPILSFSDDDTKDMITIDRVKQIIVDRFAIEAGITGSADARATDEVELQSKIGRAALLADLMSLGRSEQSAKAADVDVVAVEPKSIDLIGMEAAFNSYKEEVDRYEQLAESLDQRAAAILKSRDYTDAERLISEFETLDISNPFIILSNEFAERTGKNGVLAVFDNFKGAGTTIEEARKVFADTHYSELFERTAQGYSLLSSTESISVERIRAWVIEQIARELPSENYAAYMDAFESTLQLREKTSLLIGEIKRDVAALEVSIADHNESAEVMTVAVEKDMMVDYQIFDKANEARSVAISDVVRRVDSLKDSVDSALELNDHSMALEFDVLHDELVRDHAQLKIENHFFAVANGEGVAKVFDAFKADQNISFDDAKAAFDAAGYGALYDDAMQMHRLFNLAPVSISLDDLKLRIVDRVIARAGFDDTTDAAERDQANYYDSKEDLDVIATGISVLKASAVEAKAQLQARADAKAQVEPNDSPVEITDVDFDDNENDEIDEPHYQAAVFLFREQRQTVGNRTEDDDIRRRTKELAAVTSVNHVRTVMVLDMIATRMDMESLQFAEDLETVAPSVVDDAQWLVQRVADDASNFTLAEYTKLATVTKLENHGRKWDVRYGSDAGFSDAEDEAGAIADRHRGAVNNALYYNSPENINTLNIPMPRIEVLADYPDLVEQYPSAFIVDRPEADEHVDGFTKAYNVYGYDVLAYEREGSDGGVIKRFVLQSEENKLSAEQGVYDLDGSDITNTLNTAFEEALWQYSKKILGLEANAALEGKPDANSGSVAGDGDEPSAGGDAVVVGGDDSVATTNEAEQEQGDAVERLSVVARMAALGYQINTDALNPFEGISEAHRELLAKATVVVTDRELYEGFDTVSVGADTQILVMNAPRPMMGSVEFEADFFAGRHYGLVNTSGDNANFQIETNVKMDATLPIYMDEVTRVAFALHSNRYASSYLEMLESGEASIEAVRAEVVKHRDYTIETLEAALGEFRASFAADTGLSQEATQEPVAGADFNLNDHPFNFTLAEWNNVAVATRELTQPWSIKHGMFTDTVESASDSEDALSVSHRESVRGALELNLPSSNNGMNVPIPSGAVLLNYPLLVEEYADAFLVERPDAKAALEADGLALAAYNVYGYEIYEITDFPTNGNRVVQYFIQSHANKLAGLSDVYGDEGNYTVQGFNNALFTAREQLLKANRQLGLAASNGRNLETQVDEVAESGTIVDVEAPAVDSRVTSESAGNSRQGDIVRTDDGAEYLMMRARHDFIEACPIIDGKPQVSADTAVRFHLNPESADTYPQRDKRSLFHTGRNHYQEESETLDREQAPDTSGVVGVAVSADDAPAPAFANDADDGADEREWSGLTLDDLKRAENQNENFRGAVKTLLLTENGMPLGNMREHARSALLSFTGWGGIHETFRMDQRQTYAGNAVSSELGMSTTDFHNAVVMNRLESYYTPASVIESMWKAVQQAGVPANGKYLEPAVGSAHFFVGAPAKIQSSATLIGIDCDPIAARFARAAAPDARIIEDRFENVILDNTFDAVIGNVPFGSTKISDSRYPAPMFIHDYFIKRSLSHLKDGGLMAVITTAGTMDKADDAIRSEIMETADLVAAVRLPSKVFERDNAKVVTDILVFQKRPAGTQPAHDFTATTMLDVEGEQFRVNNFFINNPQYILGDVTTTSGQFGPKMDVDGSLEDIGERLDEALRIQIPALIYTKSNWVKAAKGEDEAVKAWDEGAYAIDSDQITSRLIGEISIVDGKLIEVAGTRPEFDAEGVFIGESVLISDVSTTKAKEVILFDYVPLRDAAVTLSVAQLNGSDDEIALAQESTLALYEAFVKKHGPVNARKVFLAVGDDPRSSEVFALESYDQDKGVVTNLAQTLYQRVVGNTLSAKVETAEDAYYVCIDHKGAIDFDYMAELSGLDPTDIRNELLGSLVFFNPKTNQVESSTTYLSGNVVQKLMEAEQAAQNDSQTFAANIAALQGVRPLLLPFEDISINLGASWIPVDDIRMFVANMCNKSSVTPREVSVSCDKDTGVWKVDALTSFEKNNDIAMRSRFGTERAKFTKLLEMALNGKKPSHYIKHSDGSSSLDYEGTMASRAKQDDIKEAFQNWVGATDERKAKYAQIYNDKINVICPPKADGSRITFPGMAASWKPRSHQSDVVAMGLMGHNVMAAHPVGAGKTFEMVALAIKLKQVGMSSKPMIAVPNHMLAQMSREAKEIFPSAKVLMVTNDDLSFKSRQRFFAVARNNDWDLIVCTHSMLDRLQAPFDIKMANITDEIDIAQRQLDGSESNQQKRMLVTKINTLKSKATKLATDYEESLTDPKKAPMLIEDIGVDTILVDEAHLYKNLFLNTGMQVLGISTTGSQRATNLLELSQYFRQMHGKCAGMHFFTGTPIANSVAELYVHNRFLRPDIFESMGINTFDQWAMNFGKTVDKAEVLADGGSIGIRTRFSEFQNLPELIKMFRTFADVRTLAELNLPTPKLHSNTVIVEQTQLGKDHMTHLGIRAVATRQSGHDKSLDNILNIATDGRKAALDLQMIDHRLPDDASNKLAEVAANVLMEWEKTHEQKGAQLVFMDLGTPSKNAVGDDKRFSGYDKLRDILVERGMPREQIAYIHDAKNDAAKDAIFKAVRSGDIRVLIGSTLKMGVGTNVQERLCALHNVDCPWRPDQLEQRIGRIMRQGNLFFDEVTEHRYVTKDSIELFMYQKLETKDKFIKQAMASPDLADRVMVEEVDAGYGDVMASATGEPRIKEKFEVDADVERLERRKRTWTREQAYVRDRVGEMHRDIGKLKSYIESYRAVQQALPQSTYKAITVRGSIFAVQDGDTTWLSATEAGIALKTRLDSVVATISRSNERSQPLKANIGPIELMVERNGLNEDVIFADLDGRSVPKFSIKEHKNPQQLGRVVRSLYNAAEVIRDDSAQIKAIEDNIARSPAVQSEWPLVLEYEKLRETKRELDEWFVKQDFDSRFQGMADPFEAKLSEYVIQWERNKEMEAENDMEAFNGADLSKEGDQLESTASDADAMAGLFDDDMTASYDADVMVKDGSPDERKMVASRSSSMRP